MKNTQSKSKISLKAKSWKLKADRGYSLIELLVAIGLFSAVVSIMSSMFITSLRGQQKAFMVQNVVDNMRFGMELISKEIRMGSNFNLINGSDLQFVSNMPNRSGATVEFSLVGGQIMFDDDIAIAPAATPITSLNINVTGLNFVLTPSGTTQKRVFISAQAHSANVLQDVSTSMNVETVVAPRILQ